MAISQNDNILTLAPKPTDFRYGPWSSTTEANNQIVIQQRYLGLTVGIYDSLVTSSTTEYWYHTGITNSDLVLKQTSGNFILSGTNIGSGEGQIFNQKNGSNLEFNTISAGTKIELYQGASELTISTSGINQYFIQAVAPSATTSIFLYDGDRWFNTTEGLECVWVDDGNSSQWVEVMTSITGSSINSGTTNYIGKFNSSTTLIDTSTPMYEGANGIVVGSTSLDPSSIFQINSTTLGFLPPRMTEAQLNAITSPAIGLIVYQTDGVEGLYLFKSDNTWHLLG